MFTSIWEYVVAPRHQPAFIEHYGPDGTWANLFRQSAGFLSTTLHRDSTNQNRFVTIDQWESRAARDAFFDQYAREYKELDQQCEHLTELETEIGRFALLGKKHVD